MDYKLIITERAEELFDNLVYYLLYRLKNEQAAVHLFDSMDKMYCRMEENPFQFPQCRDIYLKEKGYREAVIQGMDYVVVLSVDKDRHTVYVLGVFHSLENYSNKI